MVRFKLSLNLKRLQLRKAQEIQNEVSTNTDALLDIKNENLLTAAQTNLKLNYVELSAQHTSISSDKTFCRARMFISFFAGVAKLAH